MSSRRDIAGRRRGRLVAVRFSHMRNHLSYWVMHCDCGREHTTSINSKAKSCGCLGPDVWPKTSLTHGATAGRKRTPEHLSWASMKRRCLSQGDEDYAYYGGRGIKVCERWMAFENFLADMGPRPPGTTLDRINNSGDYEPGNCRWATWKEQNNNRRPRGSARGRAP